MQHEDFFHEISKKFFFNEALADIQSESNKRLAQKLLHKGEIALLNGDLSALKFFEKATKLDPCNSNIWFREGLAFFEYGDNHNDKKALFLAVKCFKLATKLNSNDGTFWKAWGKSLYLLGDEQKEQNYFIMAGEKFKQAIALSQGSKEQLAELYWDQGLNWLKIAENSGEACDVWRAILALNNSSACRQEGSAPFYCDLGRAYFQLALLVNDLRFFLQAIDYFKKSIALQPAKYETWVLLAKTFAKIYLISSDEEYFLSGDECFKKALELNRDDAELLVCSADLLLEWGRVEGDIFRLKQAVERFSCAQKLSGNNPKIRTKGAEALAFLGAFSGSLELIERAEKQILDLCGTYQDYFGVWEAYGCCLLSYGIYFNDVDYFDRAIEKFQIGLSLNRLVASLWRSLALANKKIGEMIDDPLILERASKFYSKALDLQPNSSALIFEHATLLMSLSELKSDPKLLIEGISLLENRLCNQKDAILKHENWFFFLAKALIIFGDLQDDEECYLRAIDIFNKLLLIEPNYPNIHFYLAVALSHLADLTFDKKEYQGAINFFKLAVKQNAEDDIAYLELGLALVAYAHQMPNEEETQRLYREAEECLTLAGKLGNLQVYYHLACLYSLVGKVDLAMEFIIKATKVEVLPPIDELLQDEWLENLRSTMMFANFLAKLESRQKRSEF